MPDLLIARHAALLLARLALAAGLALAMSLIGRSVRRLWNEPGETQPQDLLFDVAIGFGALAAALRVLAGAGLASRPAVLALTVLLALVAWLTHRPLPGLPAMQFSKPWLVLAVVLIPSFVMALGPPASFDALAYHLRIPEATLMTGSWAVDPANGASFYPSATEAVYMVTLAADGTGVSAQLLHLLFFVLAVVASWLLAVRLSGDKRAGLIAASLIVSFPAMVIAAGWSLADASLVFLLVSAALALSTDHLSDALALLGCAAAVKYSALLFGLPLLCVVLIVLVRQRKIAAWRGGLVGVLVSAPWYVANFVRTGNPVFPLMNGGHSGSLLFWSASGQSRVQTLLAYFTRPETLDNDLGGPCAAVLLIIAVSAVLWRETRIAALVVLALVIAGLSFTPSARVLLPIFIAGAIVGATVLARAASGGRLPRILVGVAVVLFLLRGTIVVAGHDDLFFNPFPNVAGLESDETYLGRNFAPAGLYARLRTTLPGEVRVLSVGEPRLFGFPAQASASGLADPPAIRPFLQEPDPVPLLRASGFTHLLVSLDSLNGRSVLQGRRQDNLLLPAERKRLIALMNRSTRVDHEGNLWLFSLPSPGA